MTFTLEIPAFRFNWFLRSGGYGLRARAQPTPEAAKEVLRRELGYVPAYELLLGSEYAPEDLTVRMYSDKRAH